MCTWYGTSQQQYRYFIYPLPASFKDDQPGNYIFAKVVNGEWWPVYIGQGDLGVRIGNGLYLRSNDSAGKLHQRCRCASTCVDFMCKE